MVISDVTADLIASHDDLRGLFAEAATAAVHLVVDPRNPDASQHCSAARALLAMARDHMLHEENQVFPNAIALGVSRAAIARLCADHAELRALAVGLEPSLDPDTIGDAEALALMRFVHRFEQHVHREEWTLATHHAATVC